MHAVKRVAKNTGILYAKMAITMFISLSSTRLVLTALGAEDFGIFNLVGGVVSMLGFLNASMAAASQRFMSFAHGARDMNKVKKTFNVSTLLHLFMAVIIVLFFEIVGYFLFNGVLNITPNRVSAAKFIYQFMVASTFFTIISVPYEAVITARENMLFYAVEGIIEALIKLSIAFYISYNSSNSLIIYGMLMAFLSVFLLLIRRVYCHWKYEECEIRLRYYYDKSLFKDMSSFAGWSLLGSFSSMTAFYGQGIVLNMFFGTIVNAAQGIAAQISGQLSALANTMMVAFRPTIMKSAGAGNREMLVKTSFVGTKIAFFLLGILFIPFIIEAPIILGLWLKNVPEYTILFCRLVLLKNLIEQLSFTLILGIEAMGKIKKFKKIMSILDFLPLVASYFLFNIGFSPVFIYISFIAYATVRLPLVLYFAKINCGLSIPDFLKEVVIKCAIIFFLAFITASLPLFFFQNKIIQLGAVTILGFFSFLGYVWLIGLTKDERNVIINFKKSFILKYKMIARK